MTWCDVKCKKYTVKCYENFNDYMERLTKIWWDLLQHLLFSTPAQERHHTSSIRTGSVCRFLVVYVKGGRRYRWLFWEVVREAHPLLCDVKWKAKFVCAAHSICPIYIFMRIIMINNYKMKEIKRGVIKCVYVWAWVWVCMRYPAADISINSWFDLTPANRSGSFSFFFLYCRDLRMGIMNTCGRCEKDVRKM